MRVRALAAAAAVGLILPAAVASSAHAAPEDPFVTAVHAIASAPAVDIFVGDAVPAEFANLSYGDVDALQVPSGTAAAVSVTAAGAATATPPLAPGLVGNFTVTSDVSLVAQVDGAGVAQLKPYVDDLTPTPAGQARIIVRHAAQAPTVSVDANGAQLIPALSNGEEFKANVPAGNYSVQVKVAGTAVPGLSTPIPLPVTAGFVYIVYATGDPDNGYSLIPDITDVGQAPAVTPTATTPATTTAAPATTTKPATTTTRPAIPTAVPAGDGTSGWAGPLGVPALLAITLAIGLSLAVGFGLRGNASHRR